MVYLVDSAGARITDQVDLFPGRRGAGQDLPHPGPGVRVDPAGLRAVRAVAPPAAPTSRRSATSSSMVEGNASMYLGSDRMVEMVTGEKTTLEEMGGAKMHCRRVRASATSWCKTEAEALDAVRRYLSYLPSNWQRRAAGGRAAPSPEPVDLRALVPASERQAFDMRRYVQGLLDDGLVLRDPRAAGRGS